MTGWNEKHRAKQKQIIAAANRARAEDLEFLADNGETPEAAALRLGVNLGALERWCRRHDRTDLMLRLVANGEDRDAQVTTGRLLTRHGDRRMP